MTDLLKAGLVVHTFVADTGPSGAALAHVLDLWDAVVADQGLAVRLDPRGPDPRSGSIGDAIRSDTDGFRQVLVRQVHDVVALSVAVEPHGGDASVWSRLDQWWDTVDRPAGPDAVVVGTVRISEGLLAADESESAVLADRFRTDAPGARSEPTWRTTGTIVVEGVTAWETGDSHDHRPIRRLLVLGAPQHEKALGDVVWSTGGRALTPFTRYLLHTAKHRYQRRVWNAAADSVRSSYRDLDIAADALADKMTGVQSLRHEETGALVTDCGDVDHRVLAVRRTEVDLRMMRRTVDIAIDNREAALPPPQPVGGLFADDTASAVRFRTLLDDEIHAAETARTAARDVVATVRLAAERHGEDLRQSREDQRRSFELLQATAIGSLLMLLAVIQALEYKLPLPLEAQLPLIATITGAALVLGLALVHRHDQDHPDREHRTRLAYIGSAGAAAAALGWLTDALIRTQVAAVGADPVWTPLAVVGAGLTGAWVVWAMTRRSP